MFQNKKTVSLHTCIAVCTLLPVLLLLLLQVVQFVFTSSSSYLPRVDDPPLGHISRNITRYGPMNNVTIPRALGTGAVLANATFQCRVPNDLLPPLTNGTSVAWIFSPQNPFDYYSTSDRLLSWSQNATETWTYDRVSVRVEAPETTPTTSTTTNTTTFSLTIHEAEWPGEGWYRCEVLKRDDSQRDIVLFRATAYLLKTVPPSFDRWDTTSEPDLRVHEGEGAWLRCVARGTPHPVVTWRREDGRQMQHLNPNYHSDLNQGDIDGQLTEVRSSMLQLVNISRDDEGTYQCIASNGAPPSAIKRFHLYVIHPLILEHEWMFKGAKLDLMKGLKDESAYYTFTLFGWHSILLLVMVVLVLVVVAGVWSDEWLALGRRVYRIYFCHVQYHFNQWVEEIF